MKFSTATLLLVTLCILSLPTFAQETSTADLQRQIQTLRSEIQALKRENALLKKENEQLRKRVADAALPAKSLPATNSTGVKPASDAQLTHWMTISSGKRHNSNCRYFKNSKGRMCRPDEGVACKICGG